MLSQTQIDEIARNLLAAEESSYQIDKLTLSYPGITEKDAYAVQLATLSHRKERGEIVVGKKVALTNKAIQDQLGVHEPVFGQVTSAMFVREGEPISCSKLTQPKVEPEIGFVLEKDLVGPGVTVAQAIAATAGVMPAFDIAACRIKDWKFNFEDMAADNGVHGKIVLGGTITPIKRLDLRLLGVILEKNGVLLSTATGAVVLGNPVEVISWLANKLAEYGQSLKAGDVVLPGSMVIAPAAHPGEFYKATYDRLGSVSAYFVE